MGCCCFILSGRGCWPCPPSSPSAKLLPAKQGTAAPAWRYTLIASRTKGGLMDLRSRLITPEQLARLQQCVIRRKLAYQPFIFSDDFEVGAGEHFRLGTPRE